MYPAAQDIGCTSLKDDDVRLRTGDMPAMRRNTAAASARVIGASGRNVPPVSPCMNPSFFMSVINPAAQCVGLTSGNPGCSLLQPRPRARDIAADISALVILPSGWNVPFGYPMKKLWWYTTTFSAQSSVVNVSWCVAVSYTHLRAHETRHDL